jgi:hypothetical protein
VAREALFANELARLEWAWRINAGRQLEGVAVLPRAATIGVLRLGELIERGQQVARYRIDGDTGDGTWRELSRGETVGYCKLDRLAEPAKVTRLRVTIEESLDAPTTVLVRAFASPS